MSSMTSLNNLNLSFNNLSKPIPSTTSSKPSLILLFTRCLMPNDRDADGNQHAKAHKDEDENENNNLGF
ncbi:hypothetical protein ACSBR1_027148 [Camellia fascicularis]